MRWEGVSTLVTKRLREGGRPNTRPSAGPFFITHNQQPKLAMTVGELLENLEGMDRTTEIAIATTRPKGSWSIDSVAVIYDEGCPTVYVQCDLPRY